MKRDALLPSAFIFRRLHSITGLFMALFLIQHLFINSQAALPFGGNGKDFIKSVNQIHDMPYLPVIEVMLLLVPFAIHALWGVVYLRTAKLNSFATNGTAPSLPQYPRNRAYSWQRITSWILLVGLIAHVVHMRFVRYPEQGPHGYAVELTYDPGIHSVANRLDVVVEKREGENLKAIAKDFGTAELLVVREAFKNPLIIALYTLFVLAASFHGFNGLWTFLISWGVTLSVRSQNLFAKITNGIMVFVALLGLVAIYGTYWINLRV